MLYSSLIHRAAEFAAQWHEGQYRKHPEGTPYFSHLAMVALILQKAGYDEYVVSAGFLHDVLEDTKCTEEELRKEFGDRIADLVLAVSENKKEKNWILRKEMYREKIRGASDEAAALSAADHLHNINSMITAIESGMNIEKVFTINRTERFNHERLLAAIIREKSVVPDLIEELTTAVLRWEKLV